MTCALCFCQTIYPCITVMFYLIHTNQMLRLIERQKKKQKTLVNPEGKKPQQKLLFFLVINVDFLNSFHTSSFSCTSLKITMIICHSFGKCPTNICIIAELCDFENYCLLFIASLITKNNC